MKYINLSELYLFQTSESVGTLGWEMLHLEEKVGCFLSLT